MGIGWPKAPPERGLMLLLDGEALSALASGPAARRDRVRALLAQMRARDLPVGTVAATLAEVVRGRRKDAAVFAGLRRDRVEVHVVDTRTGVRAGQILGAAGAGSDKAIDAFAVAVADMAGGAIIATTDPRDLAALAAHANRVTVADIT